MERSCRGRIQQARVDVEMGSDGAVRVEHAEDGCLRPVPARPPSVPFEQPLETGGVMVGDEVAISIDVEAIKK